MTSHNKMETVHHTNHLRHGIQEQQHQVHTLPQIYFRQQQVTMTIQAATLQRRKLLCIIEEALAILEEDDDFEAEECVGQ